MQFRCETVKDPKTEKIFLEVYYPKDAETPFVTTDPVYFTHEQAEEDALRIFKEAKK